MSLRQFVCVGGESPGVRCRGFPTTQTGEDSKNGLAKMGLLFLRI